LVCHPFGLKPDSHAREAQLGLPSNDQFVAPGHVLPVRALHQMKRAVNLERDASAGERFDLTVEIPASPSAIRSHGLADDAT
jgi:hypothetical protein